MLTPRQREAMLFIEAEMDRTGGVAPSVSEIAQRLRCKSLSHAHKLIVGLQARGFIRKLPYRARAIEVLRPVSRFAAYRFDEGKKALVLARPP